MRNMSSVLVTMRNGEEKALQGKEGYTVMEIIRGGGVDELLALCGGCCSCATCHVYVDPAGGYPLPAMGEDENDLLDGSSHRQETSRLSCQIPFTAELDGLRVTIAPEN